MVWSCDLADHWNTGHYRPFNSEQNMCIISLTATYNKIVTFCCSKGSIIQRTDIQILTVNISFWSQCQTNLVSSMIARIAFSLSFLRKPATSVSRIGSTGSKPVCMAEIELRLSSFWEIEGKSTPANKNRKKGWQLCSKVSTLNLKSASPKNIYFLFSGGFLLKCWWKKWWNKCY